MPGSLEVPDAAVGQHTQRRASSPILDGWRSKDVMVINASVQIFSPEIDIEPITQTLVIISPSSVPIPAHQLRIVSTPLYQ